MGILSIGQTALAAAQLGLQTTSNNISNASTPGYNREQIIQTEAGGENTGSGFVGFGTAVTTIKRVYNNFLTTSVNVAQSTYNGLNSNYTQITQINNMFANSTAGLSPAIQTFFNDVQTATADPSAASSRETVLTSAQTLASQFQSTSAQLSQISDGVNQQLTSSIQNINNYTSQIASLNQSIQTAEAQTNGQPPNALLDERDQAVQNLSQMIGVTVVPQGNFYNVFIGNGQPVIVGTNAYQLTTVQSPTNVNQLEVGYVNGNGGNATELPESSLTGGTVGGLLQFRSQSLTPAENAIGQMAVGVASYVNAQQELGQDLSGNPGVAMFSVGPPTTTPSTYNSGSLQVNTAISDPNAITTANYSLEFDGTNYNIRNLSTNALVYQGATLPPGPIDGLTFTGNGGVPNVGDNFLIQPTASAASQFNVTMTDTSQIAMAAPIATNAPLANTGTGIISAGSVVPPSSATVAAATAAAAPNQVVLYGSNGLPATAVYPNLQDSVTIQFNGAPNAGTYNVTDNTTGTVLASNVAYAAGSNISYNGWSVQISGNPAANDTFSIGPNTNGIGDSRNGVAIAAIQTTKALDNGGASIQDAYAQLVSSVGNQTAQLQATSTAANTQLTNATNAQQAVSGVNLDEEATNLLQYQEAYQAAAKVMSTASTLFNSLISILPQ